MAGGEDTAGRDAPLTIGEVARRAGMRASRIRYYESIGVLPEPDRCGNRRRYDPEVLHRLAVIDIAQRAGLHLDDISTLTGAHEPDGQAADHIRELAARKLPEIRNLIERAELVRDWLERAAGCSCPSLDACALFTDPQTAPPASEGHALEILQVPAGN